MYEMQALVAQQNGNFTKFPLRQKPAAFNLDEVLRQLTDASGTANHFVQKDTGMVGAFHEYYIQPAAPRSATGGGYLGGNFRGPYDRGVGACSVGDSS